MSFDTTQTYLKVSKEARLKKEDNQISGGLKVF